MKETKFSWLPFFEELLNKICTEYDARSLYSVWQEYFPNQYKSNSIDVIDPFSFIGKINSFGRFETKKNMALKYCKKLKKTFSLKSKVPSDFYGIPKTNSANPVFFYEVWKQGVFRKDEVMNYLWILAKSINNENLNSEVFEKVLTFPKVGLSKLTQLFFLCKPKKYYSYDNINRSFYKYQTGEDTTDGIQGFYNFQKIAQKVNPCCYEFSFQAWAHCKNFNLSRIISEISNNPLLNTSQKTNGTTEAKCTEYVYKQLFGLRYNKHNPLEKSFKKFLISKGIKESDIKQNCHFIDFVFIHKGKNYLCELKPSTQSQIKYAIRNAIGQLLEYEYKDNLIYDYKVIVFQGKTTKEEKLYLDHLKENHGLYFLTEFKKGYFEGNLML